MPDAAGIRPAATLVLIRRGDGGPRVLMGQRGASAAFMPSKFVFPGGAVDSDDGTVPLARPVKSGCAVRLNVPPAGPSAEALCATAIRELQEETGLVLGRAAPWPGTPPPAWAGFAAQGLCPDAGALTFIFRAITPPGRPRRFDARFFLADAADVHGDATDFSTAGDELSHLSWVDLRDARRLDLPFITSVVLAEVAALLDGHGQRGGVPFFDNSGDRPRFGRLI